jgi:hypothetical protein
MTAVVRPGVRRVAFMRKALRFGRLVAGISPRAGGDPFVAGGGRGGPVTVGLGRARRGGR